MRVKTIERRQAFLEAATELFLTTGFHGTTMSAISIRAGGSRMTLYSYFPTKEDIFAAFVAEAGKEGSSALSSIHRGLAGTKDLKVLLRLLGTNYLRLALNPKVIAVNRLITAECSRFPEIAQIFYEHGPKNNFNHMVEVFRSIVDNGELKGATPKVLATQFKNLCESDLVERRTWGLDQSGSNAEVSIKKAVEDAIKVFLKSYGNA